MARIQEINELPPLDIYKFYGLHIEPTGDTQIKVGESGNMTNYYTTRDYKLSKIEGYKTIMKAVASKNIQGQWYGKLGSTYHFILACNGHIYEITKAYFDDPTTWEDTNAFTTHTTDLGTLTDAKTTFFSFNDKVYMLNGAEYKYWTGTGSIADVVGYAPKILIGCTPLTGAGTEYESLNLLTGKKRMTFNGDGTAEYHLSESSIDSVDKVLVNGTEKTLTTHYTVNTTTGVITFTSGNLPASGLDNVEIYWTKGTGTRDTVVKNRFAILFGTAVDNRVFMYGNTTSQNTRINSELADGVPSVEYFTSTNIDPIGSSSFAITGMEKQYDRLLIHTNKPETYYATYSSIELDGVTTVNFPTNILNDVRGNVAYGQGQVLDNDPFTIDYELAKWISTNVRDERNAIGMSRRIQFDLDNVDLTKCITVDWQERGELWIANGKQVWIYNYKIPNLLTAEVSEQGIFSRLLLEDEPTCFLVVNGELYFGTTAGQIMRFSDEYLTFNGETISAHWEMNFYDFKAPYLKKTLTKLWFSFLPQLNVSADIGYITDKETSQTKQNISYKTAVFELGDVDFSDFSFAVSISPQTKPIRLRAKQFTHLKITIDNDSATDTLTVLGLNLKVEYGGETK